MSSRLAFLSALSIALTVGCAPGGAVLPGAGDFGNQSTPIYGGTPASGGHYTAVVSLHQLAGSSVYASPFCSGTLVTPEVVVAAAHCLDTAGGGRRFRTMHPNELAIYVGDEPALDILSGMQLVSECRDDCPGKTRGRPSRRYCFVEGVCEGPGC